jgi:hypothetical protein
MLALGLMKLGLLSSGVANTKGKIIPLDEIIWV